MHKLRILRNCAFVLFVALSAFVFEERLFAMMGDSLKEACRLWNDGYGYDCTACSRGLGFPPDWEAEGHCDFSQADPEEVLDLAAAYCQDIMFGFEDTCMYEYPDWLASYYEWSMPTSDPCYEAVTDPGCWFTWANASCEASEYTEWGGSCDRWLFCDCEG